MSGDCSAQGEMRNACEILVGKPGDDNWEGLGLYGRIEMDLSCGRQCAFY